MIYTSYLDFQGNAKLRNHRRGKKYYGGLMLRKHYISLKN